MTRRQLIYDIREKLDLYSNQDEWTDEYLGYLIDLKRCMLLRERINGNRKFNAEAAKQLIEVPIKMKEKITGLNYVHIAASTMHIPKLLSYDEYIRIETRELDNYNINLINDKQFQFTGYNKYIRNQIYATIDIDDVLKMKSDNGIEKNIRHVILEGIFEDIESAHNMSARYRNQSLDEVEYPLEQRLQMLAVELVIKEDLAPFIKQPAK